MTVKLHNVLQPRIGKVSRPRQNRSFFLGKSWESKSDEEIRKYFMWYYSCESVKIKR